MIVWIIVGLVTLVGIVLVARIIGSISNHVAYYLPPIAVAELAQQLNQELAVVRTYSLAMQQQVASLATAIEQTSHVTNSLDLLREGIAIQVNTSVDQWLRSHGREVFDDIIRNASLRVANNVEMGLVAHTTDVLGEYVLLQTVENLSIDVNLQARYTQPEDLREALIRVIKWHPLRRKPPKTDEELAQWFMDLTDDRRKFDSFLGRLGEELLNLQWAGKVMLQCKREIPVTEGSMKSVQPA